LTIPQSAFRNPQSPRLGIFGGSFDPVHLGHLLLADCCRLQAGLDEVWFVPTAHQPLKPAGPRASDTHRLAMLQLACASQAMFQVKTVEIDRGVSYSIDTLEAIQANQPDAELFFLMGADSLADLPTWHRPADICHLATPIVVHRAETPKPNFEILNSLVSAARLAAIRSDQIEMPPMPISSSAIRSLIAAGDHWQDLVPPPVADYIDKHGLYGGKRA